MLIAVIFLQTKQRYLFALINCELCQTFSPNTQLQCKLTTFHLTLGVGVGVGVGVGAGAGAGIGGAGAGAGVVFIEKTILKNTRLNSHHENIYIQY